MKKCSTCNLEKSLDEFGFKNKKTGTKNSICKICQNEKSKIHYQENKSSYVDRIKKRNRVIRKENRKKIREYLCDKKCIDCGESDPVVLHFDHVKGRKTMSVSNMISCCFSWETILSEISKCEIRCANCHMRKTAKQLGWWED